MTDTDEIHPGDLLIFPDGRRRCVVEVVEARSDIEWRVVWHADLSAPPGCVHKYLVTGGAHGALCFPGVFQREEYEAYIVDGLGPLPPTTKGYAP